MGFVAINRYGLPTSPFFGLGAMAGPEVYDETEAGRLTTLRDDVELTTSFQAGR